MFGLQRHGYYYNYFMDQYHRNAGVLHRKLRIPTLLRTLMALIALLIEHIETEGKQA